jgi:hypothetical protein
MEEVAGTSLLHGASTRREVAWKRLRRAGGPVEIKPLVTIRTEGAAAQLCVSAASRMIALKRAVDGVSIGGSPLLDYAERPEHAEEMGVLPLDIVPMKRPKRSLASNGPALARAAPSSVKKVSRKREVHLRQFAALQPAARSVSRRRSPCPMTGVAEWSRTAD